MMMTNGLAINFQNETTRRDSFLESMFDTINVAMLILKWFYNKLDYFFF